MSNFFVLKSLKTEKKSYLCARKWIESVILAIRKP